MKIKIPFLGDGIESANVISILVNVGDQVSEDDTLFELETDKATAPVPAPVSGTITSIDVAEGAVVKEGVVVGDIEVAGETKTDAPSVEPPKELPKKAAQSSPKTTAQTTITTDVKYESTGIINDVK